VSDTPPSDAAAVVGLGLIGGSIALALGATGFDADPSAREKARGRGVHVAESLGEAVKGAAVVFAAVSTEATVRLLPDLAAAAPRAILTDAASLKAPVAAAAASLPAEVRFVGGHPMAGSPVRGIDGARPGLFEGRPWILTPTCRSDDASMEAVAGLVRRTGAVPFFWEAARQDEAMTWISHFPHAMAAVMAAAFGRRPDREAAALAGPGLLDMTRLAGAPAALQAELLLAGPDALASLLEAAAEEARDLADALRHRNSEAVRTLLAEAAAARREIERR
jgi:prephenate dehydrogenase